MESLQFRPMVEADWPEVENIYRAGIATGHATFETAPPNTWAAFATGKRPELSLVAVDAAPEREAGEVIEDDGEAHLKIVEFLDGLKVL